MQPHVGARRAVSGLEVVVPALGTPPSPPPPAAARRRPPPLSPPSRNPYLPFVPHEPGGCRGLMSR